MQKKGQAAMEFLMTYGWAILAAIVVIGALGTYFYFNAGGTDSAFVGPPLYAVASNVQTSQVNLELKNNGADDITVTELGITNCAVNSSLTVALTSGNQIVIPVDCSTGSAGDAFKGDVTIKYTKSGSTLELTSSGSISGTVV